MSLIKGIPDVEMLDFSKMSDEQLLEIHVPKNTESLYIGNNSDYEVDEKELLLSNRLKYQLKEKINGDHTRYILEVVQ